MVNVKQEVKLREAATKKYLAAQKSLNMKKETRNIPEIEENLADMMADMMAERRMEEDMIAGMMAERRIEEDNRRLEEDSRRLEEDSKLIEERLQRMCVEQSHDMMSTENHVTEMEDKIEDIMIKMKTTEDSVMQMEKEMDQLNQLIRDEEDWAQQLLSVEHMNNSEHMKEHMKTTQEALEDQLLCAEHTNEHMKNHMQATQEALAEQILCAERMLINQEALAQQLRSTEHPRITQEAFLAQQPLCTEQHTNELTNNHTRPTEEQLFAKPTRTTLHNRAPKTEDDMTMNVKKLVREREALKEELLSMKKPEDRNSDFREDGNKWDRRLQGVTVQDYVHKMTPEDRLLRMEEEMKMMVNVRQLIRQREAMTEPFSTDHNPDMTFDTFDINDIECDSEENIQDMEYNYNIHQPEDNIEDMEYNYNVHQHEDNVQDPRYNYNVHQPEETLQDMEYNYNVHQHEDNVQDPRYNYNVHQPEETLQDMEYNYNVHQPGDIQDINPKHLYSGGKREEEQRKTWERLPTISAEQTDDTRKTLENKVSAEDEDQIKTTQPTVLLTKEKKLEYVKDRRAEDRKKRHQMIPAWQNDDIIPMVNVKQMIQKREAAWQQVLAAEQKHKEMLNLLRRTEYHRSPIWGERLRSPTAKDGDRLDMVSPVEEQCLQMEEEMQTTMVHVQELIKEEEAIKHEIDTAEKKIQDLKDEMKLTELDVLKMEDHITEIKVERKDEVTKWEEERHQLHVSEEEKEDTTEEEESEDEEEETSAESPKVVRKESPRVVRKESPRVVRKESPRVVRKESPRVVGKESPRVVRKESPTPQLSMGGVVGLFREERAMTEQIQTAEEKIRHLRDEMKATEDNVVQMEETIAHIKQERKDEEDKWEEERLHLQEMEEERVEERRKWEEATGEERQTETGRQVLSVNQMESIFSHYCPLTLDPNTANKHLFLSENNTMATHVKEKQPYLDHPDRFDYWSEVLCRESLTGRCYWEIEWRKQVSIAVAYSGIRRRGLSDDCLFGHNANSWSLEGYDVPTSLYGLQGARYIVRHNRKKTQLPICPSGSNRIGVYVDYSAGILSFYSVSCGTPVCRTHLYTFQTTFTEALYAAFWCWLDDSSVALCRKEDIK